MKIQLERRNRTPLVKIGTSRQVVIPKKIHQELGLVPGDYFEVERRGRKVIMTPKSVVDREITLGLEDFKNGRFIGPFRNAKEAIRALHRAAKR